jgi:CRISPR-associated protein Cas1
MPAPTELLPARMLNEFVYCPRLFFYEHVEGVFVHNADTLRGAEGHKRVDGGKGGLPAPARRKRVPKPGDSATLPLDLGDAPPAEAPSAEPGSPSPPATDDDPGSAAEAPDAPAEGETIHSRSVMLGSETLGVVAKLDLVEATLDGPLSADASARVCRVCPVEYKAGAPHRPAETAPGAAPLDLWDADRMQLGLQILLLRENGYACDEGVVFYRETRQRVRYALTAGDEAWIRRTVGLARACARGPIPEPLDHSPKCPRCSLVPVCLPDETRLLRSVDSGPDHEPGGDPQLHLPGFLLQDAGETDASALAEALAVDDTDWDAAWTGAEAALQRPAQEGSVRRLVASDLDTKALYINTPGVSVTRKGETVVVKDGGSVLADVRIKDLHHLAIFGPVSLSTALVQILCERDVPVSYFSLGGWFYGLTRGHSLANVFTRIRQFQHSGEPGQALPLARLFVYGKIRNQRTLLMRNHVEPPPLALRALKHAASAALAARSLPTLLGIEGAAALHYFRHFSGMIKSEDDDDLPGLEESPARKTAAVQREFAFDFKTRNRRPPRDPVNALLSLAYSLLARDCTIAACAVGFDPYVGFFHQPRFGRPALALDLMEEFRPLIADSVVLTVINNRMLGPADFVRAGDAVNLSASARKRFFFAYEKRMSDTITHPIFDYKVSYRRALELQFRLLARTLTGEIERYVPFMTR